MEPEATQGQAETADLAETTAPAPEGDSGQSTTPVQTTESGPDDGAQGESFFDPKSIEHSPELVQAYKQMQRSFTKSKQQMSAEQAKIDAYNQAIADPVGTARQLAQQYGYTMVQGENRKPLKKCDGNTSRCWARLKASSSRISSSISTRIFSTGERMNRK
jgi:hypothetical protein